MGVGFGQQAVRQMSSTAPYVVLRESAGHYAVGEHVTEILAERFLDECQLGSKSYDTAYIRTVSGEIYRLNESSDGSLTVASSYHAEEKVYTLEELRQLAITVDAEMLLPDFHVSSAVSEIVVTKVGRGYNASACSEMPSSDIIDQFESDWSLALVRKAAVC